MPDTRHVILTNPYNAIPADKLKRFLVEQRRVIRALEPALN